MSTFIINLNDTIAMSDSAVVELTKVISSCQPYVQEVGTNNNDVKIVGIICLVIVLVAIITVCGFLCWKGMSIKASQKERDSQKTKERDECQRKQKNAFVDRYLDFLKELAKNEKDETIKRQYRETLAYMIEASQKGELSKITDNKLNSVFKQNCDEEESKQKPVAQV